MADKHQTVKTQIVGTGKDERVHFAVATDKPLSREQALTIQNNAGYNPTKHGFFRMSHSQGRATWTCYGPNACPK